MNINPITLILQAINKNTETQNDTLFQYETVCALLFQYFSDITYFISIFWVW
jgi:hypothetical protein